MISPLKAKTSWIGRQLTDAATGVSWNDLAFTRGYAAFETLRTYQGVPFLLDAHLDRLERSCSILSLNLPNSRAEIAGAIHATIAANGFPESVVRIYLTGGDSPGFLPVGRERLMVFADPLRVYAARQYSEGIAIMTTRLNRSIPLAKSTDYLAAVRETIRARKAGFDEVAFLDPEFNLLEGTTFSVVAVMGRELLTAQDEVLRGITVEHTLSLAEQQGLTVRRAPISQREIAQADEIFITSTTRELIPVARIDGQIIGRELPGPITRQLHECYRQSANLAMPGRSLRLGRKNSRRPDRPAAP
jgi:branched-chain amino acid aminotransferase